MTNKTKTGHTPDLLEAAIILVMNATIGPDSRMENMTDCYEVPLDDVDALRAAISKAEEKS